MTAPRLLYIAGTGRSGTTVLELLLAQSPGVFAAGELGRAPREVLQLDRACSCGQPSSACPVWKEVAATLSWADPDAVAALFGRLESHAGFPLAVVGLGARRHAAANSELVAAVGRVTGAAVLVDASKKAGRALLVARADPTAKVLFLTRSPAGLLDAWSRAHPREQRPGAPTAVVAYYLWVLLCLSWARHTLPDTMSVTFEQLAADPEGTLAAIGAWADIDTSAARHKLAGDIAIRPEHLVSGNRIRREGPLRFRPPPAPIPRGVRRSLARGAMQLWQRALGW